AFLKAIDLSGRTTFKKPVEIYFNSPELQNYFSNVEKVWFLHNDYPSKENVWRDLGISTLPRKLKTSEYLHSERVAEYSTRQSSIINFRLEGLDQFLQVIQEKTDFEEQKENAILLWQFLQSHLEQDLHFFEAKYYWFFRKERQKRITSIILDSLKKSKWIPTKDGLLKKPNETTIDQIIDELSDADELIKHLGLGANQREQEREYAEKLGVSREHIEFIKNHPAEFEQFIANMASRKKPPFPKRLVNNPERREERLGKQLSDAPNKKYEHRKRSVRTTSGSIDPTAWLRNQYRNEDDQMICQICKEEMPFRKRNGEHYFEKKEALSRDHLLKEHEAQYLALCPLCAAKYEEFVKTDDNVMAELKEAIVNAEDCEVPISLGNQKTSIRFVEAHYHDLKVIIADTKKDNK
ncbi:MAG: hypothetical protein OXF42_05990, partial [Candidatus Dadabacteria bacterium]|nr:hypothetical protein [Candidatus Dadabacteria bacterium]